MSKKVVKLTEADLNRIVKRVVKENSEGRDPVNRLANAMVDELSDMAKEYSGYDYERGNHPQQAELASEIANELRNSRVIMGYINSMFSGESYE